MRCLFDKVTARYALQGLLKLAEGQDVNNKDRTRNNFPEVAGLFAHLLRCLSVT